MKKKIETLNPYMEERKSKHTRNSTRADFTLDSAKAFEEKYGKYLYHIIEVTNFEDGEDNWATKTFADLMDEDRYAATKLLYSYYVQDINDENMCEKFLKMLCDYTYDELLPFSRMIAVSSLSHKSIWVRSAAFSLMDHWGDEEAFKLLNTIEVPTEPWLQMKYERIKSALEKYGLRAKDNR